MFTGIQQYAITELGLSQIYLNEDKIANIRKWLNPQDLTNFEPLPVHDFGNGRLTLTDGHSRAYLAYTLGIQTLPVVYDTDDIIVCETGQMLYKNDIVWCERFHIHSVCDLKNRVVSHSAYQELWEGRCDKAYDLLTQTTEEQRQVWQTLRKDLYLYGASKDLSLLFFEDENGISFSIPNTFK